MTFSYLISSRDATTANNAWNCTIQLSGFPADAKFFRVKITGFVINSGSFVNAWPNLHYIHLLSDILSENNIPISGNRAKNILLACPMSGYHNEILKPVFKISNPNGKFINFQLLDETFSILDNTICNQNAVITSWSLCLELTPLDE